MSNRKKRNFQIEAFKHRVVMVPKYTDKTWKILEDAIHEIYNHNASGLSFEELYSCCEFLPARPEGSLDALKCVVCNCHCNFHRKEATLPPNAISVGALVPVTAISFGDAYPPYNYHSRQAPPPPQHALYPSALVLILAPGGGGGGMDHDSVRDIDNGGVGSCSNSKKRSRTKFTREQKGKMPAFAE